MRYVTRNKIRIAYQVFGQENAPVLMLITGLGMVWVFWSKTLIDLFVQAGFRVIVFDNRDSGASTKCSGAVRQMDVVKAITRTLCRLPVKSSYTLEDMADDAMAILDAEAVDRAHVMGISMGAMIAQVLAYRFSTRIKSLTSVMSASGNPRTGLGKIRALKGLLGKPPVCDSVSSVATYLENLLMLIGSPGQTLSKELIEQTARYMVQTGFEPQGTARQLLAILASGDRREKIKTIRVPTLVIHGEVDPLLPLRAGREVASLIQGAKMKIIPNMGHDLPEAVLPLIVREMLSTTLKADYSSD